MTNDQFPRCVSFRYDTNTWRVRPTSGPIRGISFGNYKSESDARSIGKQVDQLECRAQAFRFRDTLGIKGRGIVAQAQRDQLCKDRYRARKRAEKATA